MSGAESTTEWVAVPADGVRVMDLQRLWRRVAGHLISDERMRSQANRRPGAGRKPGWAAYPTPESLMAALVPAYLETKREQDGYEPTMRDVVNHTGPSIIAVGRERLRALRYKWGIPWPPVAMLLGVLAASALGVDVALPVI